MTWYYITYDNVTERTMINMKARKLIYGVGVNDSNYVTQHKDKSIPKCPYFVVWHNMLTRCYSKSYLKAVPAYEKCSVDPKWFSFMRFRKWAVENYIEGYSLDKDLLVPRNTVYSEDTCIFISNEVNQAIKVLGKKRTYQDMPVGVTRVTKKSKPYMVQVTNGRKNVYLGLFTDLVEAEKTYLDYRIDLLVTLKGRQADSTVANALEGFIVIHQERLLQLIKNPSKVLT